MTKKIIIAIIAIGFSGIGGWYIWNQQGEELSIAPNQESQNSIEQPLIENEEILPSGGALNVDGGLILKPSPKRFTFTTPNGWECPEIQTGSGYGSTSNPWRMISCNTLDGFTELESIYIGITFLHSQYGGGYSSIEEGKQDFEDMGASEELQKRVISREDVMVDEVKALREKRQEKYTFPNFDDIDSEDCPSQGICKAKQFFELSGKVNTNFSDTISFIKEGLFYQLFYSIPIPESEYSMDQTEGYYYLDIFEELILSFKFYED